MSTSFYQNSSLITFNKEEINVVKGLEEKPIQLVSTSKLISWLNTYGIQFHKEFKQVVIDNNLDDFLIKLVADKQQSNKVIGLDQVLFFTISVLKTDSDFLEMEQMIFIAAKDFVWSIQEKKGDYFEWIRERLQNNRGIVRRKNADYLLFLILESIIDNYQDAYAKLSASDLDDDDLQRIKPTPEYTSAIENKKKELLKLKRATNSLLDAIIKLEKLEIQQFQTKYFSEIKEQTLNLLSNIDFSIQQMESKMNMIFSIQGHHLNEVMKTLTLFSVLFIPLTFIAGIYGMNFSNMPELQNPYGYFIILGVMAIIAIGIIWYISKKKWF